VATAPIYRSSAAVKQAFNRTAVLPWSRKNLARLTEPAFTAVVQKADQYAATHDVSRVTASRRFLLRIEQGRFDLTKLSETDWGTALKPRTLGRGNVLDLDALQTVKRGTLQIIGNILGGWLRLRFPKFDQGKYDYAFLVHPREYADILRGAPFLKLLPESWSKAIAKRLPPFKLSNMIGLKDIDGRPVTGALMCIGWDREMFEENPLEREQKIAELVKLTRNMGIKYVGFGALLPWASRYGQCLNGTVARREIERIFSAENDLPWNQLERLFSKMEKVNLTPKPLAETRQLIAAAPFKDGQKKRLLALFEWSDRTRTELTDMVVTTGHPFTVAIMNSYVKRIVELHPKKLPLIAVVGAAGSTGSCLLNKMAADGLNNFLLVDRVKVTGVVTIDDLLADMRKLKPDLKATSTTDLDRIKSADIVVVVSSAIGTIVKSEHLKPGAIVIDDSQPRNVDPQIARDRDDIRIITVLAPIDGLAPNFRFDRHTPLNDAGFTCAGDVALRCQTHNALPMTGPARLKDVEAVEAMAVQLKEKLGSDPLRPVFYTYDGRIVPDDELHRIEDLMRHNPSCYPPNMII
jgi:predicted amino acid dehydrogenase